MLNYSNLRRFILLVFTILVIPSFVFAGEHGTIVKKSGEKVENAYLVANQQYKIVKATIGEEVINVSYSDIETVFDANGNDITNEFLGGTYKKSNESWASDTKRYGDKPWNATISAMGAFCVPFGDYYEGINSGIGFDGHLTLALNRELSLRLTINKSGMKVDEPLKMTTWKYIVGLQYNKYMTDMVPGQAMFYAVSGLGIASQKLSIEGNYYNYYTGSYEYVDESYTESDFLIHSSGGAVILISPKVGFDISASFDMVYGTISGFDGVSYGFTFDIRSGLVLFL